MELSSKYVSDKFLPDKAIDLIDEAGARVKISTVKEPENLKKVKEQIKSLIKKKAESSPNDAAKIDLQIEELQKVQQELTDLWTKTKLEKFPEVTKFDIAAVISESTGIPLEALSVEEREKLLHLEDELKKNVVGQDEAVEAVSKAIRRSRSGLKDPNRPIGAFLFLGPTGVGKTELAKALTRVLYGNEKLLVRIDMTEYGEKHTTSRLVGAPPGYVGFDEAGQLTEVVRRRPFSVILLDEIEKAHPDVYNILLQIMDDGRLTDGHGRTVNFKNSIIIMTSNVGTDTLNQAKIGFGKNDKEKLKAQEKLRSDLDSILKDKFKPEFINRIDEIVIFNELEVPQIKEIVDISLANVSTLLKPNKIKFSYTTKVKDFICDAAFSSEFGARPIKRYVQKNISDVISTMIISNELEKFDSVFVDVKKGKLDFKVTKNEKVTVNA